MEKTVKFLILIGLSLILAACAGGTSSGNLEPASNVVTNISPVDLKEMISAKDFILVNVHIPFEGDIPGTDFFIPYNEIIQNLDSLPGDKNSKIIVYCRSGSMSNIATSELISLGYTNILNLEGGFNAWTAAGFPME